MRTKLLLAATLSLLIGFAFAVTASDAAARIGGRGFHGGGWHGHGWHGAGWQRHGWHGHGWHGAGWHHPGWSHNATFSHYPGHVAGTRSFQTQAGYGATRSFDRSCSGGTCQRSVTTTTNSGRTWSRSASVTRSDGSVSWNRNATGPRGGTASRSGSCTKGSGCSSNTSLVSSSGKTRTVDRSTTKNADGGIHRETTVTGPSGTHTRSFDIPPD